MRSCIVKGCISDRVDRFPFPVDLPALNNAWIKSLQNHQELPDYNFNNYFVCPKHFTGNDYLKSNGNSLQLNAEAVPSVFPEFLTQELSNHVALFLYKDEPVDIEDLPHNFSKESEDDSTECEMLDHEDTGTHFVHQAEISSNDFKIDETGKVLPECDSVGDRDSGNDRVIENKVQSLRLHLMRKNYELEKNRETLQSMLGIFSSQKGTISKLEAELALEENSPKMESSVEDEHPSKERSILSEWRNFKDIDVLVFCISLFYFSPTVYSYMSSIIPQFPNKHVIANWVSSGLASNIFPHGVLDINKINLS